MVAGGIIALLGFGLVVTKRQAFAEFVLEAIPDLKLPTERAGFRVWDLKIKVRQAAMDGDLKLDGKKIQAHWDRKWVVTMPYETISADTWKKDDMDIVVSEFDVLANNNTMIDAVSKTTGERYCDLHFHSKAQAYAWRRKVWSKAPEVMHPHYQQSEIEKGDREEDG